MNIAPRQKQLIILNAKFTLPAFCLFLNALLASFANRAHEILTAAKQQNVIKVVQRYVVQVSDTTMMPIAASLPGQ